MNKKHYLSLPYKEKIEKLKELFEKDFAAYIIVSRYYMKATKEEGGLPTSVINKEFELGVLRKHYWMKNKSKIKPKKYD
tara:strand:+ start:2381 stop:2617 length:237 start_codon:yes stop_codon:yes gene_type:complete